MIKAVVFDVDDTLYDQKRVSEEAFFQTFPNHPTFDTALSFKKFQVQSSLVYSNIMSGAYKQDKMVYHHLKNGVNDIDPSKLEIDHFKANYLKCIQKVSSYDDLLKTIQTMSQDLKIGIIANGSTKFLTNKLKLLGLKNYINPNYVLTSEEAHMLKPDPKIFTAMNHRLDVRPSEVAYIGDSFSNDIVSAKRAGWHAFWFNHRKKSVPETNFVPDQTVTSQSELCDLLKALS
ncbi:HAD family hydrolase [Fructilactobacillus fructivorans]|uniref:HAD-IA family hydrolase n=2 Tax=Fructilactobacillus fructivorans TaxID=1614 RepID=A0AAE6P1S8_9LACO|nr:HAD family hydrolase [Fructilactobacillus fructivorans]MCT0151899.1 HAD family hydrolase [Fructilactobacillus fructivorans]MCT2867972.1 HAD family hydrolase [Fructilactobacillus fructivorans]MCT2868624.1 HAD family hydrolase [Fructilactobacillus fructivorans]MCT2873445.1 HAD family hydrolase [Fructilactobacillus fructivorans]QFX92747.1 HAD-IA family hydrolase [Fructilactobacillus fructivorans]